MVEETLLGADGSAVEEDSKHVEEEALQEIREIQVLPRKK
jgi:hypothetical protein